MVTVIVRVWKSWEPNQESYRETEEAQDYNAESRCYSPQCGLRALITSLRGRGWSMPHVNGAKYFMSVASPSRAVSSLQQWPMPDVREKGVNNVPKLCIIIPWRKFLPGAQSTP